MNRKKLTKPTTHLEQRMTTGFRPSSSGVALITVIIFTTVLVAIVGSLLRWGVHEQRINHRHFVLMDAQNAAESAVEFGVGQLSYRWEAQNSFQENELAPGNRPIQMNDAFREHFTNDRYDMELIGGIITLGRFYVDPSDPSTVDDPMRSRMVNVRSVDVYAKATVSDPYLDEPITAYSMQTLQVRDTALFSHAVFYNMDLEFHPGPTMSMTGPVHTNADIWVQSISGLTFESSVTSAGDFRYGYMLHANHSNPVTQSGIVRFNNGMGGYSEAYRGSGGRGDINSYWHSQSPLGHFVSAGSSNWRDFSINRWTGNVQDASHGVPVLSPIGYSDYVRNNPDTATVDDALNYAYALLEPNQPLNREGGGSNPIHKGVGEREKFAYKSGMTIKLHHSSEGSLPDNAIRLRERLPYDGNINSNDIHNPYSTLLLGPGDLTDYYISFWKVDRVDAHNLETTRETTKQVQAHDRDGNLMVDPDGNPIMETIGEVTELPVHVHPYYQNSHWFHDMFSMHPYREVNNEPVNSMFDRRRNTGVDLFEINVDQFRTFIENGDGYSMWQGGDQSYIPSRDFNGVLYVELPTDPVATPGHDDYVARPDNIAHSVIQSPGNPNAEMGLLVSNAATIPNPAYNQAAGRNPGFTIATNNTMYVKGHYNADGLASTGSSTAPDSSSNPEPPAALVADAIMPLSEGYGFLASKQVRPRASGFTEFNAAMIQGLRPTGKGGDNSISGGNHNFPRFLENWQNIEFRYRGSMVALYESEIATQGTDTAYYHPPNRNWGFYDLFAQGIYPPGTPFMRSFRKINFRSLTASEYDEAIAALPY